MDTKQTALDLIGTIYDAAIDDSVWLPVLERLRVAVGGSAAVVGILRRDRAAAPLFLGVGTLSDASETIGHYLEHFAADDPLNTVFQRQAPLVPSVTHEILAPAEFVETALYKEWYGTKDLLYGVGVTLAQETDAYAGVVVYRGHGTEPFGDPAVELMELLAPHLQRAFQFRHRLHEVEGRLDAAGETLDRLPMGVVLVGRDQQVIFANESAKSIAARSDSGLTLNGNRLAASERTDASELRRLIEAALDTSAGLLADPGGAMHTRDTGDGSLAILVSPLRNGGDWPYSDRAMASVFISDPNLPPETPSDLLARLYRLTPSESAVAQRLVWGMSLIEAAHDLHVSENTARRHLTRIFEKTNTKRQAELVRVLTNGPAGLRT